MSEGFMKRCFNPNGSKWGNAFIYHESTLLYILSLLHSWITAEALSQSEEAAEENVRPLTQEPLNVLTSASQQSSRSNILAVLAGALVLALAFAR